MERLSLPDEVTPSAVRPSITFALTWWPSAAPSAETPTEPPMVRKNATTAEAAPISRCAVLFCTASTRFCMVAPMPTPSVAMKTPTTHRLVASSMVLSRASPVTTRTMPPTR